MHIKQPASAQKIYLRTRVEKNPVYFENKQPT